ncbi:MAG TPA: SDR family oxidoreductase [Terriglobales bacterium]|nr:SDR family oxidoreductase [Terriglobales bacterium]
MNPSQYNPAQPASEAARPYVFWRVEGSLLNLTAVRPLAYFTWNAQSFLERWLRRGAMALMALARPVLYLTHRRAATRVLHSVLRGISRDRLDLLGAEYFQYRLKPKLKPHGVAQLNELLESGAEVVLVSQGLDHVMRPLAEHLGVRYLLANRLEFRDGMATGRLLDPVIRPRGALARITGLSPNGQAPLERLCRDLDFPGRPEVLLSAVIPANRPAPPKVRPALHFDPAKTVRRLSVRESLAGKHVLLIGVTGFIGKVWLANTLIDLPEIGKVYLLVRPQRATSGLERFEKIVEESPVFEPLYRRYGDRLPEFMRERIEVIEGDVSQPGLGMEPAVRERLSRTLDVVINSSGLTDFNPDLRDAIASNVDSILHLLEFLRQSDHAALLHLSTCYVVGFVDGRVPEILTPNYTPRRIAVWDAESEVRSLRQVIAETEARSETPEVTEQLRQQALHKDTAAKDLHGAALENQIRKNRIRWMRNALTEAGTRRAHELGWPNTYTFTKSVAESLIAKHGAGLPIAVVRPSIVESSVEKPFRGWNEGINTSAALSYLLGTFFRQLPTNERKCLDLIPVDTVTRGMTLITAALVERCHQPLYQLATSVANPCNMRRSIELTGLAHRKYYRAQEGLEYWLRLRFDTIPVSKERYVRFSAPGQKAIIKTIQRIMSPVPLKQPVLARAERNLEKLEKLIELFEPFILHNEHVFEGENAELLSAALPPGEVADFGYDPRAIDWYEFWIEVHIPALRKWTYPLIEGRAVEYESRQRFRLLGPKPVQGPAVHGGATIDTGVTWPSS